ncbi:hypothetical protein MIT9_P2220 [Methylomarinovum caldicuralii]|uniref:Uncharacterized protein n=1 Tax=Methylomarinovum caldicuralii TaxID=438856 RepID=A0AAU9C9D2_9GAMM|nr:hypothetical protein [Methylomarinovum caldicuralii]BCX82634.1 hypothetical protein MIT9_P2220 [Methylomarinovum caldicuralii]
MKHDRLMLAAILAFIHAVTSRFFVAFTREITQATTGPLLTAALLALVNFVLFVFLMTTFKRLLNDRYQFTDADLPILVLIGLQLVGIVLVLLPLAGIGYGQFLWVMRLMGIVSGLAWLGLAWRLWNLPPETIKMLRPYTVAIAAMGISYASVVLVGLGSLLGIVADILLGVIFIQETGKPEPGQIEA